MLYARWQEVVRDKGDARALHDLASGRIWTFHELGRDTERAPAAGTAFIHPQSQGAEFILELLRAWKFGRVVWPLDPGQAAAPLASPPPQCVHLKTTSASTGAPRVVAFTAEQLAADATNIVATMGLRPDWPNLGVISLAHSYGFSNLVLPLLLYGIPLILAPSPMPETVRQAAEGRGALTLPAVPALWRTWHDADAIPSNTHLAISAAAPLPVALEQAVFDRSGVKIHNFYGATECGGIAYDSSTQPRTDDAYAGQPLSNVSLTINTSGCLSVRSEAVGETYWPESDPVLASGHFESGDLAELRETGVHLLGRIGDQINVAGRKVLAETIERALRTHPGVRECLVFGVPAADARRAETIVACVVADRGVGREHLRDHLLERLPEWSVPREWRFVESLSANARGKLSRADWRRRFVGS